MKPTPHSPLYPGNLERLRTTFPGLEHLGGRIADSSLREYQSCGVHYLAWCGWDPARALTPQTLRAWVQHLVQDTRLSPNTINLRLAAVKTLVKASAVCGAVAPTLSYEFALVEKVKLNSLRDRLTRSTHRRYTPVEVRQLCRAPDPRTLVGLRDRALLATFCSSGCRLAEVLHLQRDHLIPVGTGWEIEVLGKAQRAVRRAPISREAYDAIARWLTARDQLVPSPWIFTGFGTHGRVPHPKPIDRSNGWRRVTLYARRIGLPHLSPHDLRRFVGTETAEKHGLRQAQKVLGHKLLSTTEQYYVLDTMAAAVTEGLY